MSARSLFQSTEATDGTAVIRDSTSTHEGICLVSDRGSCIPQLVVAIGGLAASISAAEPQLTAVEIGRTDITGLDLLMCDAGTVELMGHGSTRFNHEDTGSGFAFLETEAKAFTFVAHVARAPTDAPDANTESRCERVPALSIG